MLYKRFLRISSEYGKDAFYQIFESNDEIYGVPYKGMEDWLNSDQKEVEVAIAANLDKIKIGFRKTKSFAGHWIAKPVEVDPRRGVILTNQGKITQADEPNLPSSGNLSNATYFSPKFFNTIGKGIAQIPEVGKVISTLISFIWREPSVESLIAKSERRMKRLIRSEIRNQVLSFQGGSLGGVRDNLQEYVTAVSSSERQRWLASCLSQFNLVKNQFTNQSGDYIPGSIYLVFDLATLHLGLLRERVVHAEEIFAGEKINHDSLLQALVDTIEHYRQYIQYAFEQEINERLINQIEWKSENAIDFSTDGNRTLWDRRVTVGNVSITDFVRGEIHRFSVDGGFNAFIENRPNEEQMTRIQPLIDNYFDQIRNELSLQLQQDIVLPSRLWDWLNPELANSNPISLSNVISVGPLSGLAFGRWNLEKFDSPSYVEDDPGRIYKVQIATIMADQIARLVFHYVGDDGETHRSFGDEVVDSSFITEEIEIPKGKYLVKVETWWDKYLAAIKFHLSDGTSSKKIGKSKKADHYQVATFPHHYICQAFHGKRREAMKFGFRLMPEFYNAE